VARVVVTRTLPGRALERLSREHDVVVSADLDAAMPAAEAVISQLTERIDAARIGRAAGLRALGNFAVGVDNVDVVAATARRIPVVHTPGVLTAATADHAMALLLAAARRVVQGDAHVRGGRWSGFDAGLLVGADLGGKRLGIVGLGRIGTAVARRAAGFDLEVVYTSRTDRGDGGVGARRVGLDELLSTSDFVSLHAPLTDETFHLVDDRALSRMKPSAILVNVARGRLVDEPALARALAAGRLAAAALDVFEDEPDVHPELLASPRTVLTPHVGSATVHTRERMADLVCDGVAAVLRGERPPNVVNPEVFDSGGSR
jgi:glyoxylate reductase